MKKVQTNWYARAEGLGMDPDRAFNKQCVDVVDHYAEAIFPGVPWPRSVGAVPSAKDLLRTMNREYWTVTYNDPNNAALLPPAGAVLVYGGSSVNPHGHTAANLQATAEGCWAIQQNGDGTATQNAHKAFLPHYSAGYGMLIGWAVPREDKMPADPGPAPAGLALRTVTASPGFVRTGPGTNYPLAPGYPAGIAKGAKLAVKGYVAGQDPYPNDGVLDNAWYVTASGYYLWANGAGNDLSGLPKL